MAKKPVGKPSDPQSSAFIKTPTNQTITKPTINKNVKDFARSGPDPTVGTNYYAWQTTSGEKPDFGKGRAGPGTPYREVLKNYPIQQMPAGPTANPTKPQISKSMRDEAIRRRLTTTPEKRDPVAMGWRAKEARKLAMENRFNPPKKLPIRPDVPRAYPVP